MKLRNWGMGVLLGSVVLAGCGGGGGEPDPTEEGSPLAPLAVELSSPSGTVHVNGAISVQALVSSGTPDRVELLKNGAPFVTLSAPYQYTWNTAGEPEGEYTLSVRAVRGSESVVGTARTVVVDRTAPAVAGRFPLPDSAYACRSEPIRLLFTEPVKAGTVSDSALALSGSAGSVAKTLALSEDGRTLEVTPAAVPQAPSGLSAELSGAITDLAGNALVLPSDEWRWDYPRFCSMTGHQPLNDPFTNPYPDSPQSAHLTSIALDKQAKPFVVWTQLNACSAFAKRWTGTQWSAQEAVSGSCTPPQPGFNADGVPFIAQQSDYKDVYVLHHPADRWEPLGGAINVDATVHGHDPALAFDSGGHPVVAWWESNRPEPLYVKRWTGTAWEQLGGALNLVATNRALDPSIVIGADGRPIVAFVETTDGMDSVYVKRWNGTAWESLGGRVSGGPGGRTPQLKLTDAGVPYVAWLSFYGQPDQLNVSRWTGTAWVAVGGVLNIDAALDAGYPSLAIDYLGQPVVAWSEVVAAATPDRSAVHVKRWTGAQWERVGDGAFNMRSEATALWPALALEYGEYPVVTWVEGVDYRYSVYVKRQNR